MDAEIIAVGSELLTQQRVDTNSLYLQDQLSVLGIETVMKTVAGDDRIRLAATVRAAVTRSPIVILTGGLGPTADDVTREAVAAALERNLEFRQDICDWIEARFRRMNRPMAEINKRQAFIIEGAEVLTNPNGTAPGLWIDQPGGAVLLLPGPPREMKPMFERECLPRLRRMVPPMVIRARFYRVANMPESDVDQLISPVYSRYANPATTILAAPGDIQIHLRARAAHEAEADGLLKEVGEQIEALLGNRIYTCHGDPLEKVTGDLLKARGATLALAESCTGGMVAERITSVAGSSAYFRGGFVVYTDQMKTELLGVPEELLQRHTAVSQQAAEAMAQGALRRAGADYAVSVTGYAGPGGGTDENPVGTVFICVAGPDGCRVHHRRLMGERERVRTLAAQIALDLLRLRLL